MTQELINAYRPQSFLEVLGHDEAIANLRRAIETNSHAHSYLLHGPSGVGKTTLARIIAKEFEAEVIEIDAATYNGVDAMRTLCETGRHMSLRGGGVRMFVMNEVQRLSRGAWDALLTALEEPPAHLYFALTTTEYDKIPDAVLTRCFKIKLEKVHNDLIAKLLETVIESEGWVVKDDVFNAILKEADGSPRQALSILQSVWAAEDLDEVARIVTLQEGSKPLQELVRFILSGRRNWAPTKESTTSIQGYLASLTDSDFETGINYVGRAFGNAMIWKFNRGERVPTTEADAWAAWTLLDALVFPTTTYDRKIAFYAAIGRIVWGGEK